MLQTIKLRVYAVVLAWMALAVPCFGTVTITVGDHVLLPNQANQPVQIFVSGGDEVEGVDLIVQIEDGGEALGGTATGPKINNVDIITGTIFADNYIGLKVDDTIGPLIWEASTFTFLSPSKADGLLATVFIDTTGIFTGSFDLLTDPPIAVTNFWVEIPVVYQNGILTVPEPTTIVLGCIGLVCLGVCARRRRRC